MSEHVESMIQADHQTASQWAREILATPADQVLILDTETTGLDDCAEVVQIAMIDMAGNEVLNSLVRPKYAIPPEATAIHGITDRMVVDAPYWSQIAPGFEKLAKGKTLVIYNADYDLRIIRQSAQACQYFNVHPWQKCYCAMEWYARWYGQWSEYHQQYKWQRLSGGDHSALGDCRAVLALLHRMAEEG